MPALYRQYFTGEPDAARSCPSGSEGAGRRRTPVMVQRAALLPYLNPLDQFIKRGLKCRAYLRYVDDLLLFGDHKPILWSWKAAIADFLVTLRQRLHDRESTVYPVTGRHPGVGGIPFLGFRIYPHKRRLKRRNGVAFARRFRAQRALLAAGEITYEQLRQSVRGWIAHAAHGDTEGLRRALISAHTIPRSPL